MRSLWKDGPLTPWLVLTREERRLVLLILLLALIGLTARHLHLTHQRPDATPVPVAVE